jgi:predicted nucleic acid-binding protein
MREHRRSNQGIGLGDYLMAATAEGLDLATLNVRHFPMIKDLQAPFRV